MKKLLLSLLIFSFFTMLLGGWVRNAGAGLSCPDWPLCYGRLIPPLTYQVMLEYFHRLAAALVSITVLTIAFLTYKNKGNRRRYGLIMGVALVLLMAQVVLGGLTVLKLLQGEIVAMHLGIGLCFFATILYANFRNSDEKRQRINPSRIAKVKIIARLALAFVFLQVLLGGMVSSHYAGLACPDFPTCNGSWLPPLGTLQGIQFMHRLGAAAATIFILILLIKAKRTSLMQSVRYQIARIGIMILLSLQWALGIGMIFMQKPQWMSVLHLAMAILIFAFVFTINYEVKHS